MGGYLIGASLSEPPLAWINICSKLPSVSFFILNNQNYSQNQREVLYIRNQEECSRMGSEETTVPSSSEQDLAA